MKAKLLLVSALFALAITGCGKQEEPTPAPQPEPVEPEETPVDVNNETDKATLKDALYNAYLTYSNPSAFKAVGVDAEVKDVDFAFGIDAVESLMFGHNQLDLSLENFNAKIGAYARIDAENEVEGMVQAKDVSGKLALSAALMEPLPEPEPEPEPEPQPLGLDGEGEGEGEEEAPLGFYAEGEFTIAPSAFNAYFQDGKVYLDYSDEGIRTTIDNAKDLANQVFNAAMGIYSMFNEEMEPDPEPEPMPLLPLGLDGEGEEEEEFLLDFNQMIDFLTGAPGRKIYDVAEEEGFIVPPDAMVAPTDEEKAETQQSINEFVDQVLPTLVLSQMISIKYLRGGSYEFSVTLNKTKVAALIAIIEQLVEAQKASQENELLPLGLDGDGEGEGEDEVVERSVVDMFNEYCEKFNVNAKLVLDKNGLVRNISADFDISAKAEAVEIDFTPFVDIEFDAYLTLSGKVSASIKYNDEVSFTLPTDLADYVLVGLFDHEEEDLEPQDPITD